MNANVRSKWSGGNLLFSNLDGEQVAAMTTAGFNARTVVETMAVDTTLTAADSGKVFLVTAADVTATLPATVAGLDYTFIVTTLSTTTGFSISPAAVDQIAGNSFTAADNKDAINTAATDAVGDSMRVIGDGGAGWVVANVVGTWARET